MNGMVKETNYNTKITEIGNKLLSVPGLLTTAALNKNVTEIENKIPDITDIATKAALSTKVAEVESKNSWHYLSGYHGCYQHKSYRD